MKFYQEVTSNWRGNIPNHVYLLDDSRSRMRGYIPVNTDRLIMFKSALPFDSRHRKLREVENRWGWIDDTPVSTHDTWKVVGSRGDIYTVTKTDSGLTCSCSGFRFRGRCRHLDSVGK